MSYTPEQIQEIRAGFLHTMQQLFNVTQANAEVINKCQEADLVGGTEEFSTMLRETIAISMVLSRYAEEALEAFSTILEHDSEGEVKKQKVLGHMGELAQKMYKVAEDNAKHDHSETIRKTYQ